MKWVKSSEYSIKTEDGQWHIARAICGDGKPRYSLWKGNDLIRSFPSADEARQEALNRSKGQS